MGKAPIFVKLFYFVPSRSVPAYIFITQFMRDMR